MPKVTPLINSFNAGEVSPKIEARSDIEKYFSGCKTLENFIPLVEGGAKRMPGSYFVNEVKDSDVQARLTSFHFSTTQAYVLEFGDENIRFYREEAQIVTNTLAFITVMVGYIHISPEATQSYSVWNADR